MTEQPFSRPTATVTTEEVVRVTGLSRTFGRGERAVHAVRDVSFTAGKGELVAVQGRSGAGKTTLLNLVGGLDRPDSGQVRVAGHDLGAAGERELLRLRRAPSASSSRPSG